MSWTRFWRLLARTVCTTSRLHVVGSDDVIVEVYTAHGGVCVCLCVGGVSALHCVAVLFVHPHLVGHA